jgi:hypothetical protein
MLRLNLLGKDAPSPRWPWNPKGSSVPTKQISTASSSVSISSVPEQARRPSLRMLADVALDDDSADRLGFKPFADAIAGIIDSSQTATPLVLALNAKWGAGKTTLGRMVKQRLERKPAAGGFAPHVTCWFDAWMHDDAPALSTALAAEVAQSASKSRPLWRRLSFLPSSLSSAKQRRLRKGLKYLGLLTTVVGICALISIRSGVSLGDFTRLDPQVIQSITTRTGGATLLALLGTIVLLFKVVSALLPVAKSVGEFVRDPQSTAKTASMDEVRQQLGKLIRQGTPRRSKFVIFIDDLDRCRPPRAVDLLEAVNQLLDHKDVVVVLMADMQIVAQCVEIKYASLAMTDTPPEQNRQSVRFSTYGWNYLQKIVQLQFDFPVYPVRMIRTMIEDLARHIPEVPEFRPFSACLRLPMRAYEAIVRNLQFSRPSAIILVLVGIVSISWWNNLHPYLPRYIFEIMAVPSMLGLVMIGIGGIFSIILTRRRRRIDQQIRARIAAGERDFSKIEAEVRRVNRERSSKKDGWMDGLLRERLLKYIEDESELQREAEAEVMRYTAPMPRHAKRLLNRLRLLLFIAHERKMFGGKPRLSPRHIGRWAVLGDRWPELSQLVCQDPRLMSLLESQSHFNVTIREQAPVYAADRALRLFCLSESGTKLSPVIRRIVQFAPASVASVHRRTRSEV